MHCRDCEECRLSNKPKSPQSVSSFYLLMLEAAIPTFFSSLLLLTAVNSQTLFPVSPSSLPLDPPPPLLDSRDVLKSGRGEKGGRREEGSWWRGGGRRSSGLSVGPSPLGRTTRDRLPRRGGGDTERGPFSSCPPKNDPSFLYEFLPGEGGRSKALAHPFIFLSGVGFFVPIFKYQNTLK